jgi:protein involved in polysaccharide export with SLBB domain
MRTITLWLVALVLLVIGCARPDNPTSLPPSVATTGAKLGPGDVLEVRVSEHEDLSGKYEIDDDGAIKFPWIGTVAVAGRTQREVAEEIEARLADGWLRQPQVGVMVFERQNREVSVLGQVKDPGSYPFKERLMLVQAISLAGGMTTIAQPRRVKVIRETDAGRQTFEIDVTRIIDSKAADLALEPGDIVFVPESPI